MDLTVPGYAYMFGFLQADGHLQQGAGKKGKLTLEVNARDAELLREFQRLTPYNSSITERTRSTNFAATHNSVTWALCSFEARTVLNNLGLPYGRKSRTITPPHGDFSVRDYLRGVIDADGSVGYTSRGFPFISLTTASTAIGTYFSKYAMEVAGVERTIKRNTRDGIYNILYTMEAAQRLASDLYYPACLSLARKRTAADSLSAWARPAGMRSAYTARRWNETEDRILLKLHSPTAAADVLDRSPQSCNLRLWRLRTGQVPMPSSR
ncbi:LAGLIDADG family homing endonuclease [Streptomyces spinoverrucosus]|uniref:LAGLIDADG family homing endonuclease n=1 Tax=Streptomyces spinoverrucosus TaxID=284043 RepID=UPI0018C44B2B|nr:LAGLIDADG family homing endonuclease [Streptomyces spinoverrucosus]MBG0853361.1 LAGLIDADG family homing endonuclease [Streptomyces spinoverrucosus]